MARLSVVMPVKNALPFLDAAIESILGQSFPDFELVIGDDGSTDGSTERLREWACRDARIRVMERTQSGGPVGSSNWVANAGKGPIVARMDADDIAQPDRLRQQIEVFDARPDVVLVGTLFEAIDGKGRVTRRNGTRAIDPGDAPPIAHGSIMYRKSVFDHVGGYTVGTDYFEDIDLYYRMAAAGTLIVLTEPLYLYRFSETSARLNVPIEQLQHAFDVQRAKKRAYRHLPPLPASVVGPRPDTFRAIGSLRLWSGGRPGVLRQLFDSGTLGWNMDSIKTVAWALWGTVSPGTLRASMRLVGGLRARGTRRQIASAAMVEWQPRANPGAPASDPGMKPGWSVIDGALAGDRSQPGEARAVKRSPR